MQLYIIRHAIAVYREEGGSISDEARELTPDGARKMRRSADGLRWLGLEPDEIWTSPLTRAVQTAEIVRARLKVDSRVRSVDALRPGGDFDALLRLLADSRLASVALVGHEPYLSEFTTSLLTGARISAVLFKKGGAACVEVEQFDPPVRGRLCWLLTPGQMRRLG